MELVPELGGGILIYVAEGVDDGLESGTRHVLVQAKWGTFEHTYRVTGPPQPAVCDVAATSHEKLATQEHIEPPKCQLFLEVLVS